MDPLTQKLWLDFVAKSRSEMETILGDKPASEIELPSSFQISEALIELGYCPFERHGEAALDAEQQPLGVLVAKIDDYELYRMKNGG